MCFGGTVAHFDIPFPTDVWPDAEDRSPCRWQEASPGMEPKYGLQNTGFGCKRPLVGFAGRGARGGAEGRRT